MKLASATAAARNLTGRASKTRTGAAVRLGGAAAGEVAAATGVVAGLAVTVCGAAIALVGFGIHALGMGVAEGSEAVGRRCVAAKARSRSDFAEAQAEAKSLALVNKKRRAAYKLNKLKAQYDKECRTDAGDGALDIGVQPA